jgi:hypothetical protein
MTDPIQKAPVIHRFLPLAIVLAALPAHAAEAQAQIHPGVHVARAADSFGGGVNGVGASVEVGLPLLPVDLFVAGEYFFPGCDNCSLWGGSADVHLALPIPVLTPYASAGLVMRNTEVSDTTERTGGIGIGGGVNLSGLVIGAYGEGRYEFMDGDGDQLVFRIGLRF